MYLSDGTEVVVIEKTEKGSYLVEPYYTYIDLLGEEVGVSRSGRLEIVNEVFESPPVRKVDESITHKTKILQEIEKSIIEKRKELKDLEKSTEDKLNKFKKHKALKNLEDFIEGNIKYLCIVRTCYGFSFDIQEYIGSEHNPLYDFRTQGDLKLLTLFGKSNGDLQWKINQYTDGSGVYHEVFLCKSKEEAVETVKVIIEEKLSKETTLSDDTIEDLNKVCEKYNIELSKESKNKVNNFILKNLRNKEIRLREEARNTNLELLEVRSALEEFNKGGWRVS